MPTPVENRLFILQEHLKMMTDMVLEAVEGSVDALVQMNLQRAKQVRKSDVQINKIRWDIEEKCVSLLATHQPVASDLRKIIALLSIINELKRIFDYAADTSKIVKLIHKEFPQTPFKLPSEIQDIKKVGVDMIEDAIVAYIRRDEREARRVHVQYNQLIDLCNKVHKMLLSTMIEHPDWVIHHTYLISVILNLERIGDRSTNICERVIYLVTGELFEKL